MKLLNKKGKQRYRWWILSHRDFWEANEQVQCLGLIQTWHNLWRFTISQRVCRSMFCNSWRESSSCDLEQHKQFCLPGGGLLCPSPVLGLLPVSFAATSVIKDEVRLGFGGSFAPFGGLFLFALVSVVGIASTPANLGSFLIAARRLTNLERSFRARRFPFSLIE